MATWRLAGPGGGLSRVKTIRENVSEEALAQRRRAGVDRRDEVCEGVSHMPPAPLCEHQRNHVALGAFFFRLFEKNRRAAIERDNVLDEASPVQDDRIPDWSFVLAGRERVFARDGIRGGGADAVLEVRSQGGENYEEFPFFAGLKTREIVVIDRDSKRPEVHRLAGADSEPVQPDAGGWAVSEALGVRFRALPGTPPRLAIEDIEDPSHRAES